MVEPNARSPGGLYDLEAGFALDAMVQIRMSKPFKSLLQRVASEKKISVSDLCRMALNFYLDEMYAPYYQLYKSLLEEEARKE